MKQKISLQITSDEGTGFFGKGAAELLHNVDQTGSLNMACKKMKLSYSKAWQMINQTESELGYQFIERTSGGKHGGGSVLTAEGRAFLDHFDAYHRKLQELSEELFRQSFFFENRYSKKNITKDKCPIIVRGGGDLATGTIHRLHQSGFLVLILESSKPSAIRRKVSFCEAVYDGSTEVEGVTCRRIQAVEECEEIWSCGEIPLFVDEKAEVRKYLQPEILIDATLAKKNVGTKKSMAGLTIGLGAKLYAGKDVDFVVETVAGHNLARIIKEGMAPAVRKDSKMVQDFDMDYIIYAQESGRIQNVARIGDFVQKNQILAYIADTPVRATIDGVLRGIIRDEYEVKKGLKIADIDPRVDEQKNCFTISDKARCIAGSVLELVTRYTFNNKLKKQGDLQNETDENS